MEIPAHKRGSSFRFGWRRFCTVLVLTLCLTVGASAKTLKYGEEGNEVAQLQTRLFELEYYTAEISGNFDEATRTAVRIFQKAHGMSADGIADNGTQDRIRREDCITLAQYNASQPLSKGDKGENVVILQQQLAQKGYYTGEIDGNFDSELRTAVKLFQTANDLKVNGTATVQMRMMLNEGEGLTLAEYDAVRSLRSGDRGDAVIQIQTQLTELGYYADNIDGKFDSSLKSSVKSFQTANGLDDSGKADTVTRKLLNSGKGVTAEEYYKVCPLKSSSKGAAVIVLQKQLAGLEYYDGAFDGKYSTAVKNAVKAFQTANGIKATGTADAATRQRMVSGQCVTGATYNLTCELKSGDSGIAVKVMQRRLTELGYYTDNIDGKFDSSLKSAVRTFQTANELDDSGKADKQTRIVMNSTTAVTRTQYDAVRPLRSGDRGDAVIQIQTQLTKLGYYTDTIDGRFDSALKNSVKSFQSANGLDDSGKADVATRKLLNSGKGVTAEEYYKICPLKSSSRGAAVIVLQKQLTEAGYYNKALDGKYSSSVKSAVKAFQTANGIKATGTADAATRQLLSSGEGITAQEYERIKPLSYGDKGDAVTLLQEQLSRLGYYVDPINGRFSGDLKDAVKVFQAANALSITGKADVETRKLINSGKAITRTQYDADRDLVKGESGSTVYSLQLRLTELGYASDIVSGRFDNDTRRAVELFQKVHKLSETGVADVRTREVLFSGKAVSLEEYERTRAIKYGEKGSAVRPVQTTLKALGYYTGVIDGDYDYSMRKAIELYQTANGLPVDDELISPEMRAMLNEGKGIALSVYYQTIPLQSGDRGEAVKNLQSCLKELGYFTESITGRYSDGTLQAVRMFQLANGLEVTGEADTKTREVMNSGKAVSKAQFDAAMNDYDGTLRGEVIEKLIKVAESKLGCPYVHMTHGPDTFDCSGFTRYVFGQVGIYLSAASEQQGYLDVYGQPYKKKLTSYSQLKRGDLLVFNTNQSDDDLSDHLGIYLGNGTFIHASSARGEVVISDLLRYGNFSWAFRLI